MNQQLNTTRKSTAARGRMGLVGGILLVIGTCIGAGIFFKSERVLQNMGGNTTLALLVWLMAGITVILMGLALVEITAKAAFDDLALLSWTQKFTNNTFYKACKRFLIWIYLPTTFFFMPLYLVQSLQDGLRGFGVANHFNTPHDWAIWMVIVLLINLWFFFTSGLSVKWTSVQNVVLLLLKVIPLIAVVILALWLGASAEQMERQPVVPVKDFTAISPFFGWFSAMGAIFFAFDGFYVSAAAKTQLKKPKKLPQVMLLGLGIVVLIYSLIALSVSLTTPNGAFSGLGDWLKHKKLGWFFGVLNLLIALGVAGIINGFVMWTGKLTQSLIKSGELWVPDKCKLCLNKPKPVVGLIHAGILMVLTTVALSSLGGLLYLPKVNASYDGKGFKSMGCLLEFADLISTWTSVGIFWFLGLVLLGGLLQIKKPKRWYFRTTGWLAVVVIGLTTLVVMVQPFVDLGIAVFNRSYERIVANTILIAILVIIVLVMFFPTESIKLRLWRKRIQAMEACGEDCDACVEY